MPELQQGNRISFNIEGDKSNKLFYGTVFRMQPFLIKPDVDFAPQCRFINIKKVGK